MPSALTSEAQDHGSIAENQETAARKRDRTQNACDACRARKVKCLYESANAQSCNSCKTLAITCRQERPRKRRGPQSKYVETQRERDLQETSRYPLTPTQHLVSSQYGSTPPPASQGLDHLAPDFIIQQIIHDWFELVHPVAPILHRDTFLRQLATPVGSQDPKFVDLVVSLCAATISALRRRASAYGGLVTVEKCYQMHLAQERCQRSDPIDLTWCLVKYNFATALGTERGMDSAEAQLLLADSTSGVLYLLHYEIDSLPYMNQEIVKRLFWLCYAGQCTGSLHGRPFLSPSISEEIFEASQPQIVTDAELSPASPGGEKWHGNVTSCIPGLVELSKLFMMWHNSQQRNRDDLEHVKGCMTLALSSLDNLPPELRWRGGLSRPAKSNFGTDVQMVNLYITQIHIRSFFLDQMDRIARKNNDVDTVSEVLKSRQTLVDDMLAIVYQMPEDTLEANGHSLISKLRDIGLALLNDNNSERAFSNLDRLLSKLERLDVRPGSQVETESPVASLAGHSNLT